MLKSLITFVLLCSVVHSLYSPLTNIGIIFFLLSNTNHEQGDMIRDLYSGSGTKNAGDMMMMAKDWTIEGLISNKVRLGWCGWTPVLGGPGVIASQGSFSRTYKDLTSHNIIYFEINVKMIGNWKDNKDTFTMKIDGSTLKSFSIFRVGDEDKSSSCSETGNDLDTRLVGHFYHSASTVAISLAWDLSSSSDVSFAISDVSLTARTTDQDPKTNPANALLALTDTLGKGITSGSEDNGKTNCPQGHYREGNYCLECDPSCQDCFGPSGSECYQCKWGYNFDGGKCTLCTGDCALCTWRCWACNLGFTLDVDGACNKGDFCMEHNAAVTSNKDLGDDRADLMKKCEVKCPPGTMMLWNNTCVSSCEPPLVQRRQEDHSRCDYPCSLNEYLLPDGRCLTACPSGYSQRIEALHGFCDLNPKKGCGKNSLYRYQNGSCLQTCPYPYIDEISDEGRSCSPPCSQGYFDPLNEICVKRCESEYIQIEDGIKYCENHNSTTECPNPYDNRYSNGSCISSVCAYPYQQRWSGSGYFCDDPCPENYYFHTFEKRCVSSCKSGSIRIEGVINFCDPDNTCRSKSDFRHLDGSCQPDCPFPNSIRLDEEGNQFCEMPCPAGQYYHVLSLQCVEKCSDSGFMYMSSVPACRDSPDTTGCSSPTDFRYPNGSCLPSCVAPFEIRSQGSQFCDGPCSAWLIYWQPWNTFGWCAGECKRSNVRIEDGIVYCDQEKDIYGGNYCPSDAYGRYPDGRCYVNCKTPWLPKRSVNRENYVYCNTPCPFRYLLTEEQTCSDTCQPDLIRIDDSLRYCDPDHGNHNITTCPSIFEYRYSNGSCLPSCPSPYLDDILGGFSFCDPPCPLSFYNPFKQTCVDSCEPESIRVEGDISYCDKNEKSNLEVDELFSVTLGIYIRYNITLSDFNSGDYLAKFTSLVADLLDLKTSDIDIISLREGSTIVESEIVLKSGSDSKSKTATKTKASTMMKKLTSAAESKGLDLDDVSVLDYRFSGVHPEENQVEPIKSSSKTVLIIIIAVVGVAVITAAVSVLVYEMKRRSLKIGSFDRSKSYKIEESVEVKGRKKDEETSILGENSRVQGTDNSRIQASENSRTHPLENSENDMSRTEAFQLAIKTDLEQDQKDQSPKKIRISVKEKVKPTEVENVKPVSFRDIMKNIV